jgi:hypothetical protein
LIFPSEPVDFPLVLFDLRTLAVLAALLTHEVIADQSTGNQSHRPTDQGAHGSVAHGAANDRTAPGAQTETDQTTLFPRRQRCRAR